MSLQQWANNGWLKVHQTSSREIQDLLKIVERDLADAMVGDISADWRFGIAYNAALKLCTILTRTVTLMPVLKSGRQRFRNLSAAARSVTGFSGATANCVTTIAITPEIADPVRKFAANLNNPTKTPSVNCCPLLSHGSPNLNAIIINVTRITGMCANRDRTITFGKCSLKRAKERR